MGLIVQKPTIRADKTTGSLRVAEKRSDPESVGMFTGYDLSRDRRPSSDPRIQKRKKSRSTRREAPRIKAKAASPIGLQNPAASAGALEQHVNPPVPFQWSRSRPNRLHTVFSKGNVVLALEEGARERGSEGTRERGPICLKSSLSGLREARARCRAGDQVLRPGPETRS
ncbi:hypothetical protein EYF80_056704 [Liparis tanakae]|uniref:Uncharacterized protein n=1 Tax=Liparis tanakae TaxID=230148 RepID=A0A4Z2EWH1_9TELE|nr:hypothetical protein EYF80_056704 [Liparis tanakae]